MALKTPCRNHNNDIKKHPKNTTKNKMKTSWENILKTPLVKVKTITKTYFKNSLKNHPKHHVVPHFVMQTKILHSQEIVINPIWDQRVLFKNYTCCFEKIFVVIAHVFRVTCFLTMTKPSNRIHPIAVGEIFYWLRLQFHDTFATHFSLH